VCVWCSADAEVSSVKTEVRLLKKHSLVSIKQLQLQKRVAINKPVKLQVPEETHTTEELVGNRGKHRKITHLKEGKQAGRHIEIER